MKHLPIKYAFVDVKFLLATRNTRMCEKEK